MTRIGQSNIPYDNLYNNSNAAAWTALKSVGIGGWSPKRVWAPGWGNDLSSGVSVKRRLLLLALLALSGLMPTACSRYTTTTAQALKELEAAILRELPSGTSRSTVIEFLQKNNVEYVDSNDISYFKGPRTVWGLLTTPARSSSLMVVDTVLTFEFDPEDKLVSYRRKDRLVGP